MEVSCERKKCWTIIAWVLVSFVRVSEEQDFRIDNQVKIQANDCYTRIAIGSRMPENAVISTVTANSLSDCEAACSANRTVCNAFSFGIDSRGNATCRIGRMDLNTRGKDLVMDSEYDVYERRAKLPHGCQHDRLLRIGFGVGMTITNSSNVNSTALRRQQTNAQGNNGRPMMVIVRRPQNPFGNPFATRALSVNNSPREPSFFRGGWYAPTADDGDSRLYDIINNRKNYPWKETHNYDELPQHYQEVHHEGLHLGSGVHEVEHDYGYRETTSRGFGFDNKWTSGLPVGNSEWAGGNPESNHKWTEGNPELNPKWAEGNPELNPKWPGSSPEINPKWSSSGIDTKWTQRNPDFNSRWGERTEGLNTKWTGSSQAWDPKLTGTSQVPNPKWTGDSQRSTLEWTAVNPEPRLKWTAVNSESNPKWTTGRLVSNSKWTEPNPDLNPKWTEVNPELNPKWTEAYAEFGLKLNPTRLEVTPRGIHFSTSTIAPGFGTRSLANKALGLEFATAATVDPVLEKTRGKCSQTASI